MNAHYVNAIYEQNREKNNRDQHHDCEFIFIFSLYFYCFIHGHDHVHGHVCVI